VRRAGAFRSVCASVNPSEPQQSPLRLGRGGKQAAADKAAAAAANARALAPEPVGRLADALLASAAGSQWRHDNGSGAAAAAAAASGREACAGAVANLMLADAFRPRATHRANAAVKALLSCLPRQAPTAAAGVAVPEAAAAAAAAGKKSKKAAAASAAAAAASAAAAGDTAACVAFALAALMNATLAAEVADGSPRAAVVACGGVAALLPLLGGHGSNAVRGLSFQHRLLPLCYSRPQPRPLVCSVNCSRLELPRAQYAVVLSFTSNCCVIV
jgi:hypothetical protein